MRVCSLSSVKNRIVLGQPLAFSVRDADRTLLLARGQVIADGAQLDALMRRGALVEVHELTEAMRPGRPSSATSLRDRLPEEWDRGLADVRNALSAAPERLAEALDGATALLMSLIDCSPEMALAQVVRQPESGSGHYGVTHSLHAATACQAAARYLGWGPDDQRRAFQAALTMNLGMLDLQARLSSQVSPLTSMQREAIHEHPIRSVEMLSAAGIDDNDWLEAVLQHHETPDGRGYPHGISDIGELAEMLRYADVYTARLSSRANRPAMSAAQAGRELHQMAAQSPLAAALIKAFGIFPPGSVVRLASGEVGLVVKNGDKAHRPMVSALTNANGEPRQSPVLRDSSRDDHAIVALLPPHASPIRLSDERIAMLIAGA
jgi:HD-GYP domain-containing protein (c-di-GMP phosphodiesterase class II)